jgi:molybdopterin-biosynthesis enzyme MoeA-like protein
MSVVLVRNVYVLPGVPAFFQLKFRTIRDRFRREPFHLRKIFTSLDEGVIARDLDEAEKRFLVAVGSYPRFDATDHKVMITLESKDGTRVEEALAFLRGRIDPAHVVRIE